MTTAHGIDVLQQIQAVYDLGSLQGLTDRQLLERSATRDGAAADLAFAALVARHGPMVLRVCRVASRDEHDAQDAFQATFLVLMRKARSLWVRESLGPWLRQVASRTAAKGRSVAARRQRHETRAAERAPRQTGGEAGVREDTERVLYEELERLPDRYRLALVLCDLEGCTHEHAARQLGWPVGTVKSRQARGRERLRDRLIRRRVVPATGIGAMLAGRGADAAPSTALVELTTRIALHNAAAGAVPAAIAALAQGAMTSMFHANLRLLTLPLLVIATAVGAGVLTQGARITRASQEAPRKGVEARRQTWHVDRLDMGVLHVGALAEAQIGVEFIDVKDSGFSLAVEVPAFVTVKNTRIFRRSESRIGDVGCIVTLALDTNEVGTRSGAVNVRFGDRTASIPTAVTVVPEVPGRPRVLVISSGFGSASNHAAYYQPWFDLVDSAKLDVSYLESFGSPPFHEEPPQIDAEGRLVPMEKLARNDVILLTNGGIFLNENHVAMLKQFVESGKRLIVTASTAHSGAVLHANQILNPYGLAVRNEPESHMEPVEARRVVVDPLMKGVRKLTTFRPAPIEVRDPKMAKILAFLPDGQSGFVAVARPGKGEVIAIGMTGIPSWIGEDGEKSDNARLLKNLLTQDLGN